MCLLVTDDWGKLHNEELHILLTKYYLSDQIKEDEVGMVCDTHGGRREMHMGF
jgi:hypothetical protein